MWYLNPKNILFIVLIVFIVGLGTTVLFQKAHIAGLQAEKEKIEADYNIQKNTIAILEKNVRDARELQSRVQAINDKTSQIRAIIASSGGTNEDIIKDANRITDYFNNGMRSDKAGSDADNAKTLPASDKTDIKNGR